MINQNFLTCAKAEIKGLTACIGVNGEKFSKSRRDLDLDRTMPKWIEPLCFELS